MKKTLKVLLVLAIVLVLLPTLTTHAAKSEPCPKCHVQGTLTGEWDGAVHWYSCDTADCNVFKYSDYHSGGKATCKSKAKCDVYGHEYGDYGPHTGGTATCTAKAVCTVCGQEYGEPLGHSWAWVTDKAPTCVEAGEEHQECTRCGEKNEESRWTPPTGEHTFEWVTDEEPTCTEAGQKHEECSVCSAKRSEGTEIPAKGHTVVTDKGKAATCTKAGLTAGKHCSVCGQVLKKQKKVAAKGHLYQSWEPAEEGKHQSSCARCGHGTVGDCVVVAVPQADPNAAAVTLCPVCGHREGGDLVPMTDARAKGGTGDLAAFMTEAGEEERLMTVSFQRDGKLQQPKGQVTLTLPAAVVDGYDLFLIGPDGTETEVATKASSGGVTFMLPFTNGGPVLFL